VIAARSPVALRTGVLLTAALVLALAPSPAVALSARGLLERALDRGSDVPHGGEVIAVTWDDGDAAVAMWQVGPATGLAHGEAGAVADLEDKYRLRRAGQGLVLDRPTICFEVVRRADGRLRERLELDQVTGLVLRRESFDDDVRLRMATYSRLDLTPPVVSPAADLRTAAARDRAGAGPDLAALRRGGWVVPDGLPDGYRSAGVYPVADGGLQQVYDDGLYSVSLFQRPGRADWDRLPEGGRPVAGLGERAHEWPGVVPRTLLWEVGGRTFSLVGDAPPSELRALARAVPVPPAPGLLHRLRVGLERMWAGLIPWV